MNRERMQSKRSYSWAITTVISTAIYYMLHGHDLLTFMPGNVRSWAMRDEVKWWR